MANYRVVRWEAEKIANAAMARQEKRMAVAVAYVQGQVKVSINRGNRDGKSPSAPGEPPRKVSTRLFGSIFTKVIRRGMTVIGVIGTNVAYGRRLELGFVGRDSRGRTIMQLPRPFLRPANKASAAQVKKILGAK